MPYVVKGTAEEREQFMVQIFRKFYENPANAGRDLSVDKANAEFKKEFGSMLRNRKAYEIRNSVRAQTQVPKTSHTPGKRSAARDPGNPPENSRTAALIEGTAEQLAWLPTLLTRLNEAGLAQAHVDHQTGVYAVLVRTS